jgi:GT2 family glycosyltransferase
MVARAFPWVHLIANPANVGFAQASNQGLARAQGRHLLLLNPDAELPPHALAAMVGYLEQHPRAGVVGPKLVRLDGSLDPACRRSFPTPTVALYRLIGLSRMFPRSPRFGRYNLTFLDPAVEGEVDAVSGAFMLVRRQAFLEAGFLDDRFFLYGEDLDWAYRIKALGWEVRYNPDVVVLHRKGESSRQVSRSATLAFYRAMQLFFDRHLRQSTPPAIAGLIVAAIHVRMAWSLLRDRARRPTQRKVST